MGCVATRNAPRNGYKVKHPTGNTMLGRKMIHRLPATWGFNVIQPTPPGVGDPGNMFGFVYQGRTLIHQQPPYIIIYILYSKVLSTKNSQYNRPDSRKSKRRLLGKVAPICNIFFWRLENLLTANGRLEPWWDPFDRPEITFWIFLKIQDIHEKPPWSSKGGFFHKLCWITRGYLTPDTNLPAFHQGHPATWGLSSAVQCRCHCMPIRGLQGSRVRLDQWISGSVRKLGDGTDGTPRDPKFSRKFLGRNDDELPLIFTVLFSLFTAMEVMKKAGLWFQICWYFPSILENIQLAHVFEIRRNHWPETAKRAYRVYMTSIKPVRFETVPIPATSPIPILLGHELLKSAELWGKKLK